MDIYKNRILRGELPERIETFISKMDSALSLDDAFQALLACVIGMGFERISYWLIWPPEGPIRPLCLTNQPEAWVAHYIQENMAPEDYVGHFSKKTIVPFVWEDALQQANLTKKQRMVFIDSTEAGMLHGCTVPIHGPGSARATLSVINSVKDAAFEKLFLERRHELHLMAAYCHEKILKLGLSTPIKLAINLTLREIEILTWMAKGKNGPDTALILGVKEDTVKAHLANIREKLGAANTSNAIAIAMVNKLIDPW